MMVSIFNPVAISKIQVDVDMFNRLDKLSLDLFQKSSTEEDYPVNEYLTLRGGEQRRVWPGVGTDWVKDWAESIAREYQEATYSQTNQWGNLKMHPHILNCWTITQPANSYQVTHTHPYGHISGCLYLETPEFDENSAETDGCISFQFDKTSDPHGIRFVHVRPEKGMMLIFPSWLPHQVYPWRGNGNRRVIAWDCKLA